MNHTFDNFRIFFDQFKIKFDHFFDVHINGILEVFRSDFNTLRKNYQIIKWFADEADPYSSKKFNIFNILDLSKLEVRTHTPFLGELLNPHGSHGQKSLFLKTFLAELVSLPPHVAEDMRWWIQTERECIDLRIINYKLHKAIFVENKIQTEAHSGQLSRYFRLLNSYCKGDSKRNGAFIYLSPDRDKNPPADSGFDDSICPRAEVDLKIWSYQDEIHRWLSKTLPMVKSVRVADTVRQYLEIIEKL